MLQFDSIHFAYDESPVLHGVSFVAEPGAITCLVGESGCGKSTLLRLAAGLLDLRQGSIRVDDELVSSATASVPPEQRSVGLVFQEGALFPHLKVLDNVRFGVQDSTGRDRVDRLLSEMRLSDLVARYPHELSGGQRQRVALARALAPAPRVLLFDEPYANLDQGLRRQLREQTRRLVTSLGTVALFVTHDHEDVTALADTVIAMHDGRVVQQGPARMLFDHPEHASVARLFGQVQQVPVRTANGVLQTPFGDWPAACLATVAGADGEFALLVRPDGLELSVDDSGLPVRALRVAGADDLVDVEGVDGSTIAVRLARPHNVSPGTRVRVSALPGRVFPEYVANDSHSQ